MYKYYVRNELYHHGIKGQKWGVRRFQNPDGTLTAEGLKRLKSNKDINIEEGVKAFRLSANKTDDSINNDKLYVNIDKEEADIYKTMMATTHLLKTGHAYCQEYVTTNNIKIPSIKDQTKDELNLLKDEKARGDIASSLINKGMNEESAVQVVEKYSAGKEFVRGALPMLAAGGLCGTIGFASGDAIIGLATTGACAAAMTPLAVRVGVSVAKNEKERKLAAIRVSMGDASAKNLNKAFEEKLSARGANAYRDTNDANNSIKSRASIVITDPKNNVKNTSIHELTRKEYAKAYASMRLVQLKKTNKKAALNTSMLEKKGEEVYDSIMKTYENNKNADAKTKEANNAAIYKKYNIKS